MAQTDEVITTYLSAVETEGKAEQTIKSYRESRQTSGASAAGSAFRTPSQTRKSRMSTPSSLMCAGGRAAAAARTAPVPPTRTITTAR
jgi:hypothetical protein